MSQASTSRSCESGEFMEIRRAHGDRVRQASSWRSCEAGEHMEIAGGRRVHRDRVRQANTWRLREAGEKYNIPEVIKCLQVHKMFAKEIYLMTDKRKYTHNKRNNNTWQKKI